MAIQAASLFVSIGANIEGMLKGMEQANGSLKKTGDSMSAMGAKMTGFVSVPLAMVGKSAADAAVKFESGMNVMGAVSGATGMEMEKMRKLAEDLGRDLTLPATSAADAAEAMVELSKAGLSVNDTMAAAKGVLQMSAAGNLSNARAAEIAANALNMFNLKGEDAVRVADMLAAGANASSAEVTDMADSLQMAGSVFAASGLKIEELTTMIGLMANAGIKGSDAGTSLKQMMLSLTAPTDKAAGLMKNLGINVYDANGNMKNGREIIRIFSESMAGMTQQARNAALATIFGSDAVRAANVVLMGGVGAYDAMNVAVTKANASLTLSEARMKGLPGAMEAMNSSIETATLKLGQALAPAIVAAADKIADLANWFSELDAGVQENIAGFGMFVAALGPVLFITGQVVSAIGAIQGAMVANQAATLALGAALGPLAVAIAAVAAVAWAGVSAANAWEAATKKANAEAAKSAEEMVKGGMKIGDVYKMLEEQRNGWVKALEGEQNTERSLATAVAKTAKSYDEFARAVKDVGLSSNSGMGMAVESHEEATKAIWKTVTAEKELALQMSRATREGFDGAAAKKYYDMVDMGTGRMKENFKAAGEAAKGLTKEMGLSAEAAKALSDQFEAQLSLIGQLQGAEETYLDTAARLKDERIKIENERSAAIAAGWSTSSAKVVEYDAKLAENSTAAQKNAAEHELANKKIIYGLVERMLMQDGLTQEEMNGLLKLGVSWGIYSQDVVNEATKVLAEAKRITDGINGIPSAKDVKVAVDGTQAITTIDTVRNRMDALQNKTVTITTDYYENHHNSSENSPYTLPGMASGGSVLGGSSYIVGERGPELFVPKRDGTIVPNDVLSGKSGGTVINLGGITINGNADAGKVKEAAYDGVMRAARSMGMV